MRPVTIAVTAAGFSIPLVCDYRAGNIQGVVDVNFTAGPGVGTVTVQYSATDPFSAAANAGGPGLGATWYDLSGATALTANTITNIVLPITMLRLNVTAYTSGTIYLKFINASSPMG